MGGPIPHAGRRAVYLAVRRPLLSASATAPARPCHPFTTAPSWPAQAQHAGRLLHARLCSTHTMSSKDIGKYLQQSHDRIFENNRKWAEEQKAKHPEFFTNLSAGQSPEYLWIGEPFSSRTSQFAIPMPLLFSVLIFRFSAATSSLHLDHLRGAGPSPPATTDMRRLLRLAHSRRGHHRTRPRRHLRASQHRQPRMRDRPQRHVGG